VVASSRSRKSSTSSRLAREACSFDDFATVTIGSSGRLRLSGEVLA
jgi:hypothetical protein